MIYSVIWPTPGSLTQQWWALCPAMMDCSLAIRPLSVRVGVFYRTVLLLRAQVVEAVTCQTVPHMQFILAQKEVVEGLLQQCGSTTVLLNHSAPSERKSPRDCLKPFVGCSSKVLLTPVAQRNLLSLCWELLLFFYFHCYFPSSQDFLLIHKSIS